MSCQDHNRLSEIGGRSFKRQGYRADGLQLGMAAIILWSAVDLVRAVQALGDSGKDIDEKLPHLAPLGWKPINQTSDCISYLPQQAYR